MNLPVYVVCYYNIRSNATMYNTLWYALEVMYSIGCAWWCQITTFSVNGTLFWEKFPNFIELFYSASALLTMQSAVLARAILSVCPSVTLQYCVQTNEDTIVQFSVFGTGKTLPLVSEEVKFIWIFAGHHASGALKWGTPLLIGKIRPIIGHNLETVQDRS